MPLSHVSLATGPALFGAMRTFYVESLAVLGYGKYVDVVAAAAAGEPGGLTLLGLGPAGGAPDFWLHVGHGEQEPLPAGLAMAGGGDAENEIEIEMIRPGRTHVAFEAESRELVDRWFDAAV